MVGEGVERWYYRFYVLIQEDASVGLAGNRTCTDNDAQPTEPTVWR